MRLSFMQHEGKHHTAFDRKPQSMLRSSDTKLNKEIVEILRQPDVATRLAADGSEPVGSTPEQFGQHIRSEVAKWGKLTKQMNINME